MLFCALLFLAPTEFPHEAGEHRSASSAPSIGVGAGAAIGTTAGVVGGFFAGAFTLLLLDASGRDPGDGVVLASVIMGGVTTSTSMAGGIIGAIADGRSLAAGAGAGVLGGLSASVLAAVGLWLSVTLYSSPVVGPTAFAFAPLAAGGAIGIACSGLLAATVAPTLE